MEIAQDPAAPIIIEIAKPKSGDPTGLSDVLLGALGLTGVIVLLAILVAAIFAGVVFWWRSKTGLNVVDPSETRDERFI
jgi:hypothetical protein